MLRWCCGAHWPVGRLAGDSRRDVGRRGAPASSSARPSPTTASRGPAAGPRLSRRLGYGLYPISGAWPHALRRASARHIAGEGSGGLRHAARSADLAVLQPATHRWGKLPRRDRRSWLCLLQLHPPQRTRRGGAASARQRSTGTAPLARRRITPSFFAARGVLYNDFLNEFSANQPFPWSAFAGCHGLL